MKAKKHPWEKHCAKSAQKHTPITPQTIDYQPLSPKTTKNKSAQFLHPHHHTMRIKFYHFTNYPLHFYQFGTIIAHITSHTHHHAENTKNRPLGHRPPLYPRQRTYRLSHTPAHHTSGTIITTRSPLFHKHHSQHTRAAAA